MKQKQISARFNKHNLKASKIQRKCCFPDCKNLAINSHILQKNGILTQISNNGHIYVLRGDFLNPNLFFFKKSGLNTTYTFKGFCMEHDKSIFRPIEDFEIDYEDYNSQLLFAYRTILNERRKKEMLIDSKHLQLKDNQLYDSIDISITKQLIAQERLAIKDIAYYEHLAFNDMQNGTENFIFKTRYTQKADICLASYFSYETTIQREKKIFNTGNDYELLTGIFISYFPLEEENVLMMGYAKSMEHICGEYVSNFFEIDESTLFRKISNLLLGRCEEWACSEHFYQNKIQPREELIINHVIKSIGSLDENIESSFNIFD